MKIVIIGSRDRYQKYLPDTSLVKSADIVFLPRSYEAEELLSQGTDADAVIIDPMAHLPGEHIEAMPKLRMIQSEGVGYNHIDYELAKSRGIFVSNCKGANAAAVAEQTVLLMLALLRSTITGDRVEREGRQAEMKERLMFEGITELGDCRIGLIGFGDIARATAKRLIPFECELYYTSRTRKPQLEEEYHVTWLEQDKLISTCDIVSLHCPVTPETVGMVDAGFLARMKPDAYLVNTARGDLVDNLALYDAIVSGRLRGAGLDTVYPEPTTQDNLLLNLPAEYMERITFSPHIGGITTSFFRRAHRFIWENVERALSGERPEHIVNGL